VPLLLSVLLTLLAFAGLIPDVDQQQDHRIVLSLPEGYVPGEQDLARANEINISLFEVSDPQQLRPFTEEHYNFFVLLGPDFAVPGHLSVEMGYISANMAEKYQMFENEAPGRIVAASLLRYPYENFPNFLNAAQSLADSLDPVLSVPLYYQSAGLASNSLPRGFNFVSERMYAGQQHQTGHSVVHFIPSADLRESYIALNQTMNRLQDFNESILILSAPWFFTQLESRNELRYLFQDYTMGEQVTLPLPAPTQPIPSINWSFILLMLILGSYAVHLRYQPMYGPSVIRYFTNHSFYVADVYEHRLRNVMPGFYLMIQHAFICGLFAIVFAEIYLSSQGFAVLENHFPGLMVFGGNIYSLFAAGLIIAVLVQAVSLLWIYFTNRELTAFSQVLNLYCWPLHLNLIAVTLLVVLHQIGINEIITAILSALFILIWFFSFNIAVIDSAKFLTAGLSKVIFITLTAGIHLIIVVGIIYYAIYTPSIIEPILFAIEIP